MNDTELNRDNLLGSLLEELLGQRRSGRPIELEKVCEDHPQLALELRELYSTLCVMERHKPVPPTEAQIPNSVRELGSVIGGYQILQEIGRGGMGIVFEAIQLSLNRHVALKVISQHLIRDAKAVERFRREARLASLLHHSNIVPVFDVGEENGVCFYAMQYIPGQSLDQVIAELVAAKAAIKNIPSSPAEVEPSPSSSLMSSSLIQHDRLVTNSAKLALQVAEALAYAHDRGILHRDIKPSNILVDTSGNAWVTDFGLARLDDSSSRDAATPQLTDTGNIAGTLRYLAPERLQGQNDHRGDIYGLAATIFELATGRPIFESSDRVHLMELLAHQPPPEPSKLNPLIPRDFETILLKGLSREPKLRYQTAQSMADDLKLFLLDRPIRARRPTGFEKAIRWVRRNRLTTSLSAILVTTLIALLFGLLLNRSLQRQRDEAVRLFDRATVAESESQLRARLNEVATYRMTMQPGLTLRLRELEKTPTVGLNDELKLLLRNEITACLMRADWYRSDASHSISGQNMTIDRDYQWTALIDPKQQLFVSRLDDANRKYSVNLGFSPDVIAFSQNAKYLFANDHSQCQIYRIPSLQPIFPVPQPASGCTVCGERDLAIVWTSDRKFRRFDIGSETVTEQMVATATGDLLSCRIHPRENRVACLMEGTLRIWDLAANQWTQSVPMNSNGVLEWSPDGQWLAISQIDNSIQIRDARNLHLKSLIPTQGAFISRMEWDRSSQRLATQNWARATYLYDAKTTRLIVRSKLPFTCVQFSNDGHYFGWDQSDDQLSLLKWQPGLMQDLSTDAVAKREPFLFAAIHQPLGLLATASPDRIFLIDYLSGSLLATLPNYRPVNMAFTSDGSELITLGYNSIQRWPIQGDRQSGSLAIGPPQWMNSMEVNHGSISSNGKSAYVISDSAQVVELDLNTGAALRTICSANGTAIRLLDDQSQFVLSHWHLPQHEIRDTQSGTITQVVDVGVNGLMYIHPDSHTLVTCNPREYRFWDYPSLKKLKRHSIATPIIGARIAWSCSNREVSMQTADQSIDVVNQEDHRLLCQLPIDPQDSLEWLEFVHDDRYLMGIVRDSGTIRRWDIGRLRQALRSRGLDWDREPLSTAELNEPTRFAQIHVDTGELGGFVPGIRSALREARLQYQLKPDSARNNNQLAWCLMMVNPPDRDNQKALELAEKAGQLAPDNADYQNTLGLALYRNSSYEKARQAIELSMKNSAESAQLFDFAVLALIAKATNDLSSMHFYSHLIQRYCQENPNLSISSLGELELLQDELRSLKPP